jgi:hypothetical protein
MNIILSNKNLIENKILSTMVILIVIIVFLNQLSVSGDIFSTWTGGLFWYIFGMCSGFANKVLKNEN